MREYPLRGIRFLGAMGQGAPSNPRFVESRRRRPRRRRRRRGTQKTKSSVFDNIRAHCAKLLSK